MSRSRPGDGGFKRPLLAPIPPSTLSIHNHLLCFFLSAGAALPPLPSSTTTTITTTITTMARSGATKPQSRYRRANGTMMSAAERQALDGQTDGDVGDSFTLRLRSADSSQSSGASAAPGPSAGSSAGPSAAAAGPSADAGPIAGSSAAAAQVVGSSPVPSSPFVPSSRPHSRSRSASRRKSPPRAWAPPARRPRSAYALLRALCLRCHKTATKAAMDGSSVADPQCATKTAKSTRCSLCAGGKTNKACERVRSSF